MAKAEDRIGIAEAAVVLDVSTSTVYNLIYRQQLPAFSDAARRRWVRRSDALRLKHVREQLTRDQMACPPGRRPRQSKRVAA